MRFGMIPTSPLEWLAARGRKIPLPILDIIVGPVQAQALMAAVSFGLFDALADGPATQEELARRCDMDSECLGLVARVVRAMGYVVLSEGRFELSATGRHYFGADAPEPYSDFVRYGARQWQDIARTPEVLGSGVGVDVHASMTPEQWPIYQRAMAENAAAFAWFVVEHCPVPRGARRLLDLAGSHGIVGAALARRHPPLKSTVLERPEAIDAARSIAESRGLTDVVDYREGNLLTSDFGQDEVDVALMCNVLHHFDVQTNRELLGRVHAALRSGGTAAVFDIETPEPTARPDAGADAFSLFFRVSSTSACFRGADYEAWLEGAGFTGVRTVRSVRMPSRLLAVGTKR